MYIHTTRVLFESPSFPNLELWYIDGGALLQSMYQFRYKW